MVLDAAAERKYRKSLARPIAAVSAAKAGRPGSGAGRRPASSKGSRCATPAPQQGEPVLLGPAVVRPKSASMHQSSLYQGDRFSIPLQQGVYHTARKLQLDSESYGMSRFNVALPPSPQHSKYSRPGSAAGECSPTQDKTRYPLGMAFNTRTLRSWFDYIDKDHSGSITQGELIIALRDHPRMLLMFSRIRGSQDPAAQSLEDVLSMPGVGAALRAKLWRDEIYWIREILKEADTDGSGSMDWPEFLDFFRRAGMHVQSQTRDDLNRTTFCEQYAALEAERQDFLNLRRHAGDGTSEASPSSTSRSKSGKFAAQSAVEDDMVSGHSSEGEDGEPWVKSATTTRSGMKNMRRAQTFRRRWWKDRMSHPRAEAISFQDPRSPWTRACNIVAFLYRDEEAPWDHLCTAGCLGNYFDCSPEVLQVEAPAAPGVQAAFLNAEAAFHALGFWPYAQDFATLSGDQARSWATEGGRRDPTFAGFGSAWDGMRAVLIAKFGHDTRCGGALLQTEDAFLLYHEAVRGRDPVWSDNSDGEGANWLGLQLMLIRDRMTGSRKWTSFIEELIDVRSGEPWTAMSGREWQKAVREAKVALMEAISAKNEETYSRRSAASPSPF